MNNKMTWLDLYNFLYEQVNDIKNVGKFDWSAPVVVHDAMTGEESSCDTYFIGIDTDKEEENTINQKFVLITNMEKIFDERS